MKRRWRNVASSLYGKVPRGALQTLNLSCHLIYFVGFLESVQKDHARDSSQLSQSLDFSDSNCLPSCQKRDLTLTTFLSCLSSQIVRVVDVVQILRKTQHNGFPVFSEDGRLVGLILRSQLLVLLEHQHFVPMPQHPGHRSSTRRDSFSLSTSAKHRMLERAMRMYHLIHNPHRRYLNSSPEIVDALNLDRNRSGEAERGLLGGEHDPENGLAGSSPNGSPTDVIGRDVVNLALDLTPFMNRAPLTVSLYFL